MKEINGDSYNVSYNSEKELIVCDGTLRLYGSEGYAPIMAIFEEAAERKPETLTLNIKGLQFLNSSGINTIAKFVIKVRKLKTSTLVVMGNPEFSWQKKSLKNLEKLLPGLQLKWE